MTPSAFKSTVSQSKPPAGLAGALAALWWAAKGDWDKAHTIVMNDDSRDAAWVHAYLHRLEGDLDNARYWYRTAGRPVSHGTAEAEWDEIIAVLAALL